MDYLNRQAAPFGEAIWKLLDEAAVSAGRALLTGRRFLEVTGPYGVGLTSLEIGNDMYCREPAAGECGAVLSQAISIPMLRKDFQLSIRRIAAHEQMGEPLILTPVRQAAEAVAAREEEFIYRGEKNFRLQGLLTANEAGRHSGGDWSDVHRALEDVLAAVNQLDARGFRGPYALALAPRLYNRLFRLYEGTELLQLDHIKQLCQRGVYKASIDGGVLVDPRAGRLVIGQDLMVGYSAHDGVHYRLFVSESIVLMLEEPQAICTLGVKSDQK